MSLIGSVVERTPNATGSATSVTPFPVSSDPKTGFPTVAHRSQRQRKSAFRQNMEAARPINRDATIPAVKPFSEVANAKSGDPSEVAWRSSMEAENARKVALMTSDEREEGLRQLRSKFGDIAELSSVLRRAKDSRPKTDNKRTTSPTIEEVSDEDKPALPPLEASSPPQVHNPQHRVANPPRPVLSRRSSVSGVPRSGTSTPGAAGVRFAEVTSRDVFTYPSAPTSPKRTTLMIEAPPAEGSGEKIPKLQWKGKIAPTAETTKAVHPNPQLDSTSEAVPGIETKKQESAHPLSQVISSSPTLTPPEVASNLSTDISSQTPRSRPVPSTGGTQLPTLDPIDTLATPEAIRQQYFPNEPQSNPNLQWMADLPEIPDTPVTSEYAYIDGMGEKARFNLAGTPIPQEIAKEMPAHDGLHHNSRSIAGYTLGELLHLARSTAPMQRAMALDALARLSARVGRRELAEWFPHSEDSKNRGQVTAAKDGNKRVLSAAELRKLVIESATSALNERGAVGTRAIDCLYATLVIWDHELALVDDVELSLRPIRADESNLHVMPSNYVTPTTPVNESGLDEMKVVDNLMLEPILETAIRQFSAQSLPKSVLGRLLEVIVRLSRQSRAHASSIMATKGLIAEIMRSFVLSVSPYPDPSDSEQPNALAIRLLTILACSSRQNANLLLDPTDTLLRFVAVLPPEDIPPTLLIATLDLYSVLGQYGMYAHIATTAADSFNTLSKYVHKSRHTKLTKSWMRLRMVWTTCAIDPHSTTPPHEILWSQIEGWGWGEDTIAWVLDDDVEASIIFEAWNALTVWLEGATVNSIRAGAMERERVIEALREGFQSGRRLRSVLESAISRLSNSLSEGSSTTLLNDQSITDANVICSALRLDYALLPSSSPDNNAIVESPLGLPLEAIAQLVDNIAVNSIWSKVYSNDTMSPYSYARTTPLALCIGSFLLLAKRVGYVQGSAWLKLSFIALHRLNPACADIAARLIQEIGTVIAEEPNLAHMSEHLKQANWSALLPFFLHDLQPSANLIVAPPMSSSASISHITTLLLPSRPSLGSKSFGLPVRNDWAVNPLNHLLHSGTSPVFKSLPNEWDSDEVDVVRTTLALTCARQKILSNDTSLCMTSAEVSFACMRIFMLEHGQPHDDSSSEIFRDPQVERMMSSLLHDVSLPPKQPKRSIMASPLETVANTHLSGQPFYQFYTDLIGLYDAISFAHPLFSRILLPPLSMNYARDYRRLFWGDYGHILRSIQTELPEVPSDTLEEWLWPRDKDAEMIGWYVKALMKGGVQGFLRFIAVHHVATSIWPEFDSEGTNGWDMSPNDKERTRMIIGAIVHQAGPALFGALMLYEQKKANIIPYPACYEGRGLDREQRHRRLEWAISLCGERVRERLEYVYNA